MLEICKQIEELDIDRNLICSFDQSIEDITRIDFQLSQLHNFVKEFKISEEDLKLLVDENQPIDEKFFEVYKRLDSNIQFRNSLLRTEMIQNKLPPQGLSSYHNNHYVISKKLALRKLSQNFEKKLEEFLFDYGEMEKHLVLINENQETQIGRINNMIIQKVSTKIQKYLTDI